MCKVLGSVPSTAQKGGAEALKFKARQNNGVLVSNSLHVWPSHQTLPSGVSLSRHTCEGHTTQQYTAHKHWCELTTDCMQRLPFANWRTYSNRTMRKKWKHLACPCFRVSKLHFPYKSSKVRGKRTPLHPTPAPVLVRPTADHCPSLYSLPLSRMCCRPSYCKAWQGDSLCLEYTSLFCSQVHFYSPFRPHSSIFSSHVLTSNVLTAPLTLPSTIKL